MKKTIKISLIFSLLIPTFLSAQSLKDFDLQEISEQQIPLFVEHPNEAAYIFYSAISGLTVESNTGGVVAIKQEATKLTVFLKPERQILTIKSNGFIEKKIVVESVSAKQAKFFKLNSTEKNLKPDKGSVVINSVPTGALVTIDGIPDLKWFTPFELKDYEAKNYRIKLVLKNYTTLDTNLVIESGLKQSKTFFLETTVGFLTLSYTRPVEALLNTSKIKLDTEPVTFTLKAGQQTLKIQEPGYEPYNETFTLNPGEILPKVIVLLKLEGIAVFDFPEEVSVKINDQIWKKAEGTQTRVLVPGTYKITVSREGYDPWQTDIIIKHKEQTRVTPTFNARKSALTVNVNPEGARVILIENGQERALGFAPVTADILQGTYDVQISADGYEQLVRKINAKNGEKIDLSVSLKRTSGNNQVSAYQEPEPTETSQHATSLIYGAWVNNWFGSEEFKTLEEDGTVERKPFGFVLGFRHWMGENQNWAYDAQIFFAQPVNTSLKAPIDKLYLGGASVDFGWYPFTISDFVRPHLSAGLGIVNLGESPFGIPTGEHLVTKQVFGGVGIDITLGSIIIDIGFKRSLFSEGSRVVNQVQIVGGFAL